MKVIVDTCVWSNALRNQLQKVTQKDLLLEQLIENDQVVMLGPIRQELLSGIKDEKKFDELKSKLQWYDDFLIKTTEYELAASLYNKLKSNGIQGSHIDFLICAVALNHDLGIYTYDKDFFRFASVIPIKLLQ
ncbi:MAG: PIN domain-containing protein [Ignavibacteriales bacterium]|nr:PIN domain-containing protein [Ignavibacteriales bacterium]